VYIRDHEENPRTAYIHHSTHINNINISLLSKEGQSNEDSLVKQQPDNTITSPINSKS
jgi:hypothetical protein